MIKSFFICVLLTSTMLMVFSCANEAAFDSEFDISLELWNKRKKINGASYLYTVSSVSVFGFGSNTTLTVNNGIVISRAYEAYNYNEGNKEITESWTENQNELGTHNDGAEAISLDKIYAICKSDILTVNEDENYITFLTENDGVVSTCSYFPKNCQDDCSMGFTISSIVWAD